MGERDGVDTRSHRSCLNTFAPDSVTAPVTHRTLRSRAALGPKPSLDTQDMRGRCSICRCLGALVNAMRVPSASAIPNYRKCFARGKAAVTAPVTRRNRTLRTQ